MTAFQLAAIDNVTAHTGAQLEEQGIRDAPVAALAPRALAGVASDGRGLSSLLTLPDLTDAEFDRIVTTQLADVARHAAAIERAVRPDVTTYVRAVNLPACGRCIILAGKPSRTQDAFNRHPRCFPAGAVISGPNIDAASRRWYDGELVILTTASGEKLSITGNHPVLTRRGWVPANMVGEGDYVVRSTLSQGAAPLVIPNHHQVPALVEDVWRSLGMGGLLRMPTSPEDFHGDGVHGEVDVVLADGALARRGLSSIGEPLPHELLADALGGLAEFYAQGSADKFDLRRGAATGCFVCGIGLRSALLGGHLRDAHKARLAATSALHAGVLEDALDWASRDPMLLGERVLTGSGEVGADDLLGVDVVGGPRWDAASSAVTVEGRARNASLGRDLVERLSGQVELDRVIDVRRVQWSGHVYSLTSSEGWLSANSLIVSNCDCIAVPSGPRPDGLVTDPRAAFRAMSEAEQDRAFTRAGAEAVRVGADPVQVVNARRGMSTAADGRLVTSEGASVSRRGNVRGVAGRAMRAASVSGPRLMPESILQIADTPSERVRLLKAYGYITT